MTAVPVPSLFGPVLERLATDAASYFGVSGVSMLPVESHHRQFSYLVRLSVRDATTGRALSHLFVKIYRRKEPPAGKNGMRDRVADDFEATLRAYTTMQSHGDLGIVPPVACYPDLFAIVTEEVQGATLLDHLQRHAAWFPSTATVQQLHDTMERVGRWIRVYQTLESPGRQIDIGELRRYVDHRLETLQRHGGISANEREDVLSTIDVLGGNIRREALLEVPIHADLALGNVLISKSRVVVLDFAMAKHGTRLHDLTRLFVQMDLMTVKPQFRHAVIARLQRALLAGFDPDLRASDPLFRVLLLLHRTNHLTTLVVNRAAGAEAIYNGLVRRRHRRWISGELAASRRTLELA